MENSKKFLAKSDYVPFISFKEQAQHTVKLVADRETIIHDKNTNVDLPCVKYLVEEGGVRKSFSTTSTALISKLSAYEPGSVVTIKLGSSKGTNGFVSTYEVFSGELPLPKTTEPEMKVDADGGMTEVPPGNEESASINW